MKKTLVFDSPIGRLGITALDGAITNLVFAPSFDSTASDTLLEQAAEQLRQYFAGERSRFELPLAPLGTEFQRSVWKELMGIAVGKVRTYGEVAKALGRQNASRAVGGACNRNPIPIIIPCHRVVGANGTLTGYAGGLDVKQALLQLEAKHYS